MNRPSIRRALAWPGMICMLLHAHAANAQVCDSSWSLEFAPELNGLTHVTLHHDDGSGSGSQLYVAGEFTHAAAVLVNQIARFDGQTWHAVGNGVDGPIYTATVFGQHLYVGGSFQNAGGALASSIARWDGAQWWPVGAGVPGTVRALASYDDGSGSTLFAGGAFDAGAGQTHCLMKWDGVAWSPVMAPASNINLTALAVFNDGTGRGPELYAGGEFTLDANPPQSRVAKWDGKAWTDLGVTSGFISGWVNTMVGWQDGVEGTGLYAGGYFETIGGITVDYLARWDGATWTAVGGGLPQTFPDLHNVASLLPQGSGQNAELYVAGQFEHAGGQNAGGIAKLDADGWSTFYYGQGFVAGLGHVSNVAIASGKSGPQLMTFGNFPAGAARWNGNEWTFQGKGLYGHFFNIACCGWSEVSSVQDIIVHDDGNGPAVFAGGSFRLAGDSPAHFVAKWDGQDWTQVGGGVFGSLFNLNTGVKDLEIFDDGWGDGPVLYACGSFSSVGAFISQGGTPAFNIARWDGETWTAIPGPSNYASCMKVFDDGSGSGPALYVGGHFTSVGGVSATRIARWDGKDWSALGTGLNHEADDLEVFDDGSGDGPALYAAGHFTTAGGATAWHVAKWDGQAWSALGSGVPGIPGVVSALEVYDAQDGSGPCLYAGGAFSSAGDQGASNLAKWNGSAWSAAGGGVNSAVRALRSIDDGLDDHPGLYVGGVFTEAGGMLVKKIARWSGSSWSPLGDGFDAVPWLSGPVLTSIDTIQGISGFGEDFSIFVGGRIENASGIPTTNIARWTPVGPSSTDINGDCVTNVDDLLLVINDWGDADSPADVNQDGIVDVDDLLEVINHWG